MLLTARAARGRSLPDYLLGRGLLPEAYFGVDPALIRQAGTLTEELFRRFTDRRPTELDRARVFTALMEQSRGRTAGLTAGLTADGGSCCATLSSRPPELGGAAAGAILTACCSACGSGG